MFRDRGGLAEIRSNSRKCEQTTIYLVCLSLMLSRAIIKGNHLWVSDQCILTVLRPPCLEWDTQLSPKDTNWVTNKGLRVELDCFNNRLDEEWIQLGLGAHYFVRENVTLVCSFTEIQQAATKQKDSHTECVAQECCSVTNKLDFVELCVGGSILDRLEQSWHKEPCGSGSTLQIRMHNTSSYIFA